MTVDTDVSRALERVRVERDAVARKRRAFDRFTDRVEDVDPATRPDGGVRTPAASPVAVRESRSDGRAAVREAFAETVRPHATGDVPDAESNLERMAAELNRELATALSPAASGVPFSPSLKEAVLAAASAREDELRALETALDREEEQLTEARSTLEEPVDWIARADETPLLRLGFDDLAARHERLEEFTTRCERVARARQAFLDRTTGVDGQVGVGHRSVAESLYEDFSVDYPVLSTAVRVTEACRDCQRAVRDHLVRRV